MKPADRYHPVEALCRLIRQGHVPAHHAGYEMSAGRMSGKAEWPVAKFRHGIGGSRDFGRDLCDPHLRGQCVADHSHRPASRQRSGGEI